MEFTAQVTDAMKRCDPAEWPAITRFWLKNRETLHLERAENRESAMEVFIVFDDIDFTLYEVFPNHPRRDPR